MKISVLLALALSFSPVHASIAPVKASSQKTGHYLKQGVFIGGTQGRDLSLLRLDWTPAGELPVERIELTFGEADGRPLEGPMGYYHVAVEQNPPRLVIDLAQVQRTGIDDKTIRAHLAHSKFISSTDFTMDPEDLSTNLTLHLKHPVKLETFERVNQGQGGVLVLDLKSESILK